MKHLSIFVLLALLSSNLFAEIIERKFEWNDNLRMQLALTYSDTITENAPAVLVVPGGGPSDRDGTAGDTPRFVRFARTLAEAGYVVLRYGKPGVFVNEDGTISIESDIYNQNNPKIYTKIGARALSYLRRHRLTDPERIGVIGKSEGSITSIMVALKDENTKALAVLSPVGQNFLQCGYYVLVNWNIDFALKVIDANHDHKLSEVEFNAVPVLPPMPFFMYDRDGDGFISMPELTTKLTSFLYAAMDNFDDVPSLNWLKEKWSTPNFKRIVQYQNPVLIIGAELDYTVPVSDSYLLHDSLLQSGHTDATLHVIPGVGHQFLPPTGTWGQIETLGDFPQDLYDILLPWLALKL